jgi:hypothetical protein
MFVALSPIDKSFCGVLGHVPRFYKKRVAPATQDATQSAEKSRHSGKVCFFCEFLQGIIKKSPWPPEAIVKG